MRDMGSGVMCSTPIPTNMEPAAGMMRRQDFLAVAIEAHVGCRRAAVRFNAKAAGRERRRGFDTAVDAMPSAGGCGCVVEIELLVLLSKAVGPPRVSHM